MTLVVVVVVLVDEVVGSTGEVVVVAGVMSHAAAPCRAYLTAHLCLLVNEDDQSPEGRVPVTADDLRHHLGASG